MPAAGIFLESVERLYSAALNTEEWPHFLAAMADLLAADNVYLSRIEHNHRNLDYVVLQPASWGQLSVERYAALMNDDPRIAAFRGSPGRALHCGMTVSRKDLHASRIYQEALEPLDIEHTLLVNLPESDGGATANYLGLTRGLSGTPFDASDCAVLNELVPHLSRAFAMRNLVYDGKRQQDVLGNVLARLPYAAFVVTRTGAVRRLNEAARTLSEAGLGLRVVGGCLRTGSGDEHDQLLCALAAAACSMDPQKIVLKPLDPKASLVVTLDPAMPTMADPLANHGGERLIVVSVEPMWRQGSSEEDRLRGLFGLSPSQARLTSLLMSGRSVKEAATTLGITEGSVRQYLKIIFIKTGAKRQADLVRVIGHALSID